MKLVIKSSSSVKLYSGELNMKSIALFLKENFDKNYKSLTHEDKDGDKIRIDRQEDVEILKELAGENQYLRLYVECSEKPQLQIVEKKIEEVSVEKKEEVIVQNAQEKEESKFQEKVPKWQKFKEAGQRKREWRRNNNSECSFDGEMRPRRVMNMIEEALNAKVAQMVDDRVKKLIPAIKNQVDHPEFQVLVDQEFSHLKHEGITCIGCSTSPIVGIRYSCTVCPNFNYCSNCEKNLGHEHNFIQMKKVQKEEEKPKVTDFAEVGRKLLRQMLSKNHPSDSDENRDRGHSHHRHHHRGEWMHHEGRGNMKFERRLNKLTQLFGKNRDYEEFIKSTLDLKCQEMIRKFADQQKIDPKDFQQKRNAMKKQKLAAFYGSPESEFDEIVKANPDKNFRQIIRILKENGDRTHTGENFKRMRHKMRQSNDKKPEESEIEQKEEVMVQTQTSEKVQEKIDEKIEEKVEPKPIDKGAEIREKGRILLEMKELFGDRESKQMFKFIEQNFTSGSQAIITKWFQLKSSANKKA